MDSKHWDDVKCKKYGFPCRVYTLFALNGGHLGFIMQVTRPLGTSQQSRFIISMFCSDATSKFEGKVRLLLLNVQKSFIHQILSFDLNIHLSKKKRGRKIRCSNTLMKNFTKKYYLQLTSTLPINLQKERTRCLAIERYQF